MKQLIGFVAGIFIPGLILDGSGHFDPRTGANLAKQAAPHRHRTSPRQRVGCDQPGGLWGVLSVRALGGALAGVLVCVVLLRLQPGLIGMEPQSEVLPQSYVGLLTDAAGKPTVLASSKRHGRLMTVKLLQPVDIVSRLAVSIEAAPAKTGDKPPGDFVLSGHCVKLW